MHPGKCHALSDIKFLDHPSEALTHDLSDSPHALARNPSSKIPCHLRSRCHVSFKVSWSQEISVRQDYQQSACIHAQTSRTPYVAEIIMLNIKHSVVTPCCSTASLCMVTQPWPSSLHLSPFESHLALVWTLVCHPLNPSRSLFARLIYSASSTLR